MNTPGARRALVDDLRLYAYLRQPARRAPGLLRMLAAACTSPGWWQLVLHRIAHASHARRRGGGVWRDRLLSAALYPAATAMKVLTKNDMLELTVFEAGVYLSNTGGIVLGARRIGAGSLIHHNVTIGMNITSGGVPDIGRGVWIGHDSVVHGEITIGDGVTVLPGSVLTKGVPPAAVVEGNPARVVRRNFDNRQLRSSLVEDPRLPPTDRSQSMARGEMVHAG